MHDGTIVASHLWKRFRVDRRRPKLKDHVQALRSRSRGGSGSGWRWALRDVALDIAPGESVGLVGVNGSGKSTLLKILCRVMYPYAGRVELGGRVGALIEVRAGIHQELTGRENAFLYGSILGASRREVSARFDEIVAFAEVEDAIDRQVKFYSMGMQMRLGFAIAASLNPAVLLVDEVLAVGDASFQQKCLDRMRQVLASGTTLVFVSHDLAAVEATCARGIWLQQGVVACDGPVRQVLENYRLSIEERAESGVVQEGPLRVLKVQVGGKDGETPRTQEPLEVTMLADCDDNRTTNLLLGFSEGPSTPIFTLRRDLYFTPGQTEVRCLISRLPLPRGRYFLWLGIFGKKGRDLVAWHPAAQIEVIGPALDPPPPAVIRLAPIHVDAEWEAERT